MQTPLAERLRPQNLADYVGQSHLVGEKGSLSQMIASEIYPPCFYGGLLGQVKQL